MGRSSPHDGARVKRFGRTTFDQMAGELKA
jgi:hypothetical protein